MVTYERDPSRRPALPVRRHMVLNADTYRLYRRRLPGQLAVMLLVFVGACVPQKTGSSSSSSAPTSPSSPTPQASYVTIWTTSGTSYNVTYNSFYVLSSPAFGQTSSFTLERSDCSKVTLGLSKWSSLDYGGNSVPPTKCGTNSAVPFLSVDLVGGGSEQGWAYSKDFGGGNGLEVGSGIKISVGLTSLSSIDIHR